MEIYAQYCGYNTNLGYPRIKGAWTQTLAARILGGILKILTIFIFIFFASALLAQVDFEYNFSFSKIDSEDELINIWLNDLNEDGIDEIYAGYRCINTGIDLFRYRIVTYDLFGNIVTYFEQILPNLTLLLNCTTFRFQDQSLLITVSQQDSLLNINLFDFNSLELIDDLHIDIGENYAEVNCIEPIIIQNNMTINVGVTEKYCSSGSHGTEIRDYSTKLHKISYEDEAIQLIETIDDCGESITLCDDFDFYISTGYYYYSYSTVDWGNSTKEVYLKIITKENPSQVFSTLCLMGSAGGGPGTHDNWPSNIEILSLNEENYSEQGLLISYNIHNEYNTNHNFINYSPELSNTDWISTDTDIIEYEITASTCISVNGENHYVMYFNENQLEIRNRINGNVIHSQNASINPISILRETDGELFFITPYGGSSYNVYTLSEEIQVSSQNYQISNINFSLNNYPNPFNPATKIEFSTQKGSYIELSIYNMKGQKIKTLINNEFLKGSHSVSWNGVDELEKPVSSGLYFYKLKINGKTKAVNKCILLK